MAEHTLQNKVKHVVEVGIEAGRCALMTVETCDITHRQEPAMPCGRTGSQVSPWLRHESTLKSIEGLPCPQRTHSCAVCSIINWGSVSQGYAWTYCCPTRGIVLGLSEEGMVGMKGVVGGSEGRRGE